MKMDLWDIGVAVVVVVVGVGKFCETQSEIIMPDRVQWQIHLGEVHRSWGCSG